MGKSRKKFYASKAKIKGQIHAKNAVYIIDVPEKLWEVWVDMITDLGIDEPAHLLEVHLDNHLRRRRRNGNLPRVEKVSMEVAVDKNLLGTLSSLAELDNKSHRDYIISFMRRIRTRYEVTKNKYLAALEKWEKEVDPIKKRRLKNKINNQKVNKQ
ncbi:MAG: hypothetical protein ACK5DE_09955 [Bacteroidota bacterium]|jgi:hypothetical protein